MQFSVCMSVYHGDNALFFQNALDSIFNQTLLPSELVLIIDGPVGEDIDKVVAGVANNEIVRVIRLEKNSGHAISRQAGLDAAQYDYVAIMDSDDLAKHDRFEKQVAFVLEHPEVDALGGQINEFIGETNSVVGKRIVPLTDDGIKAYMKSRCPMNLVTMMLKKKSVEKVGGFIDWYCEEDYYLWIRMAEAGMTFANLSDILVNVRVGKEMYERRGGIRYFRSEAKLQQYMFKQGVITFHRYIYNVLVRFAVQVAMPNSVRSFVFQKLFRD